MLTCIMIFFDVQLLLGRREVFGSVISTRIYVFDTPNSAADEKISVLKLYQIEFCEYMTDSIVSAALQVKLFSIFLYLIHQQSES